MKFTIDRMPIGLSSGRPLDIDDPRGATLRVVRGRVWITQEGSVDDVFLDAGSGHTFRGDGRVVVSSEGARDATILFDVPLAIADRASPAATLKRLLTWRHAPLSIASNAYDGV